MGMSPRRLVLVAGLLAVLVVPSGSAAEWSEWKMSYERDGSGKIVRGHVTSGIKAGFDPVSLKESDLWARFYIDCSSMRMEFSEPVQLSGGKRMEFSEPVKLSNGEETRGSWDNEVVVKFGGNKEGRWKVSYREGSKKMDFSIRKDVLLSSFEAEVQSILSASGFRVVVPWQGAGERVFMWPTEWAAELVEKICPEIDLGAAVPWKLVGVNNAMGQVVRQVAMSKASVPFWARPVPYKDLAARLGISCKRVWIEFSEAVDLAGKNPFGEISYSTALIDLGSSETAERRISYRNGSNTAFFVGMDSDVVDLLLSRSLFEVEVPWRGAGTVSFSWPTDGAEIVIPETCRE